MLLVREHQYFQAQELTIHTAKQAGALAARGAQQCACIGTAAVQLSTNLITILLYFIIHLFLTFCSNTGHR
jgi:hypothetical protein